LRTFEGIFEDKALDLIYLTLKCEYDCQARKNQYETELACFLKRHEVIVTEEKESGSFPVIKKLIES